MPVWWSTGIPIPSTLDDFHPLYIELVGNLLVFEHDLTMDALLENGLSDIGCCYHSKIIIVYTMHTVLALILCFIKHMNH